MTKNKESQNGRINMPHIGDKIGPYKLINKLGQGAFGAVWLAERHTSITITRVAVKCPLDDDVDLQTIKHEADLWVQASGHPNVVPIIEANVYDGQVVIVSEYAPDGTLAERLSRFRKQPPPVDETIEITLGILAGLEHLHSKKIIHRDLKPSNILLQGETPRLTDFGISRILKSTSQSSNIAGTPVYMAPEAFDGKRSAQTDIWSVGVILYELLAGRLPYPQADITSLVGAILTRNPDPLPSAIPGTIQEVVAHALQKSTKNRYQSVIEMRTALRKATHPAQNRKLEILLNKSGSWSPSPPPPLAQQQPVKQGIAPHYVYAATALLAVLILSGAIVLLKSGANELSSGISPSAPKPESAATPRPNLPKTESPQSSQLFQSIESKLRNGYLLSRTDLVGFSQYELRLLRNTVYARHGRLFQTAELQRYFENRSWYVRNSKYNNNDLTENDKVNVKLIQEAER